MREINTLVLYFPHGISVSEAEGIARKAQNEVMAGISSGGFTPLSKYGVYQGGCEFSKDSMTFEYGHNRLLDNAITRASKEG